MPAGASMAVRNIGRIAWRLWEAHCKPNDLEPAGRLEEGMMERWDLGTIANTGQKTMYKEEHGRFVKYEDARAVEEELARANKDTEYLLSIVKLAYRKHHLNDDSIGWNEFDDNLLDALCNIMGEDGYNKWIKEITRSEK